jgi:serine/threonine protein kinase
MEIIMFDSSLPISFYKEIAPLSEEHRIYFVQHIETKKVYLKKTLSVFNLDVYEQLFKHHSKNTPRLYAMYLHEGLLTIIEEYISGDTLQEVIDLCGSVSEADAVSYAIKLCDILVELHSQQPILIHRDIKPSNVILTEDERIILIDLNAARQCISEKERDTRLIGTEGYAAPEQFGFGNSSCQTDIYAVGNLIKTLLGADTDPTLKISPKLSAIIHKCLEMNPKDRYLSAAQLKTSLKKL